MTIVICKSFPGQTPRTEDAPKHIEEQLKSGRVFPFIRVVDMTEEDVWGIKERNLWHVMNGDHEPDPE